MAAGDTIEGDVEGMANEASVAPATQEQLLPPSKMQASDAFKVLQSWARSDIQFSAVWRIQAKEDFAFRAGEQWTEEDKQLLNAMKRPHIVFNRVLTILKAVAGMEINGRHEIQFLPVGTEDTQVNEVLSAASKWMASGCDGEDEESSAFDDCATCGMGWTENRLSYEDNPAGIYIEECISPLEMYWDRTARKKNLTDSRRMFRVRRMPLSDARMLFPNKSRVQLDAGWAMDGSYDLATKTLEEKRIREENTTDTEWDDNVEVTIVHMQWIEKEVYWLVADEATQTKAELTEKQYQTFVNRMHQLGMEVVAARMVRKVFKQAFLGSELLMQISDSPVRGRFSWCCITGELDKPKGTWFGLIKVMRDPQMWANKWLSQTLHILNTTAKGGILAEADAFDDIEEAEQSYAQTDRITLVATGALSGDNPKIIPKPGQGFAQGHVELMQFAITAIRDCTGINLELLGLKDQNQPGVLEAQRKQAGMTVLATLFDSLRRFRKQVGRIRLYFIQTYFSDGRLIRVAGPDQTYAVQLAKERTTGEYDVIVDDAPTSPNMKEQNWLMIQPLLGAFKDYLVAKPRLLAAILEYSPLPSRLLELLKQMIKEAEEDPKAQQEAQENRQLMVRGAQAQIAKDEAAAQKSLSGAQLDLAKAEATGGDMIYNIAMAQNMLEDNNYQGVRQQLEAILNMAKADAESAKAEKLRSEARGASAVADGERAMAHAGILESTAKARSTIIDAETKAAEGAARIENANAGVALTHEKINTERAKGDSVRASAEATRAATAREKLGTVVDALTPMPPGAGVT